MKLGRLTLAAAAVGVLSACAEPQITTKYYPPHLPRSSGVGFSEVQCDSPNQKRNIDVRVALSRVYGFTPNSFSGGPFFEQHYQHFYPELRDSAARELEKRSINFLEILGITTEVHYSIEHLSLIRENEVPQGESIVNIGYCIGKK